MTLIKVCGITNLADARAAVKAGASALGFNFYRRSPRYVAPEVAREIGLELPPRVLRVGVFVNEDTPATVERIAEASGVEAVQLHGDESADYCHALAGQRQVIKALRVSAAFKPEEVAAYPVAAILLDAYSPALRGGTGHTFDWEQARRARAHAACLYLAGGLTAANVPAAIREVQPYAVDVCSGVESAPGRKDTTLLHAFAAAVLAADEGETGMGDVE